MVFTCEMRNWYRSKCGKRSRNENWARNGGGGFTLTDTRSGFRNYDMLIAVC